MDKVLPPGKKVYFILCEGLVKGTELGRVAVCGVRCASAACPHGRTYGRSNGRPHGKSDGRPHGILCIFFWPMAVSRIKKYKTGKTKKPPLFKNAVLLGKAQ